MGTTSTTNYNLIKPNPFEEEDTWGPILNSNMDKIDTQMKVNADAVVSKQTSTAATAAVAAVTPAADTIAYFTSGTAAATSALTAFARTLLAGVSATAMRTTLDAAATVHTHVIADVTGLQTALDGKAALIHTHAIADVTGLQTNLDGKAALSHTHTTAQVTGLDTALAAKAPLASPAFTGTPTAPTAGSTTNTTQVATTAFVQTVVTNALPTALYDIGGFVIGRPGNNTSYSVNATIAGSSLYSMSAAGTYNSSSGFNTLANEALVNTGSWRCVSSAYSGASTGYPGLWVRYA